jgi:hypothetical protein
MATPKKKTPKVKAVTLSSAKKDAFVVDIGPRYVHRWIVYFPGLPDTAYTKFHDRVPGVTTLSVSERASDGKVIGVEEKASVRAEIAKMKMRPEFGGFFYPYPTVKPLAEAPAAVRTAVTKFVKAYISTDPKALDGYQRMGW